MSDSLFGSLVWSGFCRFAWCLGRRFCFFEFFDFGGGEGSEFTGAEAFEGEGSDTGAGELADGMAQAGEHVSYLAIASFAEGDFQQGTLRAAAEYFDFVHGGFALFEV